jgi:transposase-like protein
MHAHEERMRAVRFLVQNGLKVADTIRQLEYPSDETLRQWHGEYRETGSLHAGRRGDHAYTAGQRQAAVDCYLENGRSLKGAIRTLGYPDRRALRIWIDKLAPGQRMALDGTAGTDGTGSTLRKKRSALADLEAGTHTADEVASRHGVSRTTPCRWRRDLPRREKGTKMTGDDDGKPTGDSDLADRKDRLQAKVDMLEEQAAQMEEQAASLEGRIRWLKMEHVSGRPRPRP